MLDLQNWSFLANLAYGVTAGRDPQTATNDMFAYQDMVDTGEIIGPRAYSTGPGVFPDTDFQSLEDAKGVVDRYKRFYRTPYLKSYLVGNRKQREWMVDGLQVRRMMPTTEGGLDMKLDLTHALDGFSGNEHSMPVTPLYKDVVELFAKSGIFYTPTLLVAYGGPWAENYCYENTEVHDDPKIRHFIPHNLLDDHTRRRPIWVREDEQVFPRLASQDAKIIKAGGKVCIGSHGQFQGLGYHWEMWSLAAGGMGNMEVLRSATIHGAEAIGLGPGPWLARTRQTGRSGGPQQESSGRHPQHRIDPLCDEKRRTLRRRHPERNLAGRKKTPALLVVGREAVREPVVRVDLRARNELVREPVSEWWESQCSRRRRNERPEPPAAHESSDSRNARQHGADNRSL